MNKIRGYFMTGLWCFVVLGVVCGVSAKLGPIRRDNNTSHGLKVKLIPSFVPFCPYTSTVEGKKEEVDRRRGVKQYL